MCFSFLDFYTPDSDYRIQELLQFENKPEDFMFSQSFLEFGSPNLRNTMEVAKSQLVVITCLQIHEGEGPNKRISIKRAVPVLESGLHKSEDEAFSTVQENHDYIISPQFLSLDQPWVERKGEALKTEIKMFQ